MTRLISAIAAFSCLVGTASGQEVSQTCGGLRVSIFNVEAGGGGGPHITLRLTNVTAEAGQPHVIAVASAQPPMWFPVAANLTGSTGLRFWLFEAAGIRVPQSRDDWLILNPGGSVPVRYSFGGAHRPDEFFNFSAEFLVATQDQRGRTARCHVYFPGLSGR
jgi:hypothetical protein